MSIWWPKFKTIVLANGIFPVHKIPITLLKNSKDIICCDGAVNKLVKLQLYPTAIVGDMDSIEDVLLEKFTSIIHKDLSQETNDLTKAMNWCKNNNREEVAILGASGKREDHTIGNIFLLLNYAKQLKKVVMHTDTGIFTPILFSTKFNSFSGQNVSIFSPNLSSVIISEGLQYPLKNIKSDNLWQGTLNQSFGDRFTIKLNSKQGIIVYQGYQG